MQSSLLINKLSFNSIILAVAFVLVSIVRAEDGSILGTGIVTSGAPFNAAGDSCGIPADKALTSYFGAMNSARDVTRGASETFKWQVSTTKPSGSMTIEMDDTCKGLTWNKKIDVTTTAVGSAAFPEVFQVSIPGDLKCNCAQADMCLIRFKSPSDKYTCAFINVKDAPVVQNVSPVYNGEYQGYPNNNMYQNNNNRYNRRNYRNKRSSSRYNRNY